MNKYYKVNKIPKEQLIINGKGDNPLWRRANSIVDFCSPWELVETEKIEFRALWDDDYLFFCFRVHDCEIHIDKSDNTNLSINNSDRVELFFQSNGSMNPYYCLEIDATARVMDFIARPGKYFNFNWKWPLEGLCVKSKINETNFVVEGTISIKSIKTMGLLQNRKINTGVYRAKYSKQNSETFRPTWITWVNPETEEPNFHIASSFGIFELVH